MFLLTLQKLFNKNAPLGNNFEQRLLDHFKFQWAYNRNQFLMTEEDQEKWSQVPFEIQLKILRDFCYPDFMSKFSRLL